jgi:hypothetical protein
MKFFIPGADSPEQEQRVYDSIKAHLGKELGATFSDQRIYSLRWKNDGRDYLAEVGKPTDFNGELVIAILLEQQRKMFHVCTPNRGVVRGMPILAGLFVTDLDTFDAGKSNEAKK